MVVLKVRVITVAVHTHTHSGVYPGIEPLCAAQGGAVSDTNYREQRGRGPHSLPSLPPFSPSLTRFTSITSNHTQKTHTFTQKHNSGHTYNYSNDDTFMDKWISFVVLNYFKPPSFLFFL